MEQVKQAIQARLSELFFYSPYNILRNIDAAKQQEFVLGKLEPWLENKPDHTIFTATIEGKEYYFLYQYLPWDSNYFNYPTFKLFTVVFTEPCFESLTRAVNLFNSHIAKAGSTYCFVDIPAEDILLMQALTAAGFRLTETRLTYYHDQVSTFDYPRFPVRAATQADIMAVKQVASSSRNNYDRYHADSFFTPSQADAYLATYAEACINGLCETVLVPAEEKLPVDAFLAISHLKKDSEALETKLSRVVLTAVGPGCKGWHVKLVAETIQHAKEHNCEYVLMTTQATNRAVFRTSEKVGFKLGNTTHILAIHY